jgi:hypothetical protein
LQALHRTYTKPVCALNVATSDSMARHLTEGSMALETGADLDHGCEVTMDCALAQATQATEERLAQQIMGESDRIARTFDDELSTMEFLQRVQRAFARSVRYGMQQIVWNRLTSDC